MNVDDPKLTAYALNELDEPERSAIGRAVADSPEVQRFVAETQEFARGLRSQYQLELQRGFVAPKALTAIEGDGFWSKAGPLAIAALIAVFAVVGAVMFSGNESRISSQSRSDLPRQLATNRAQPNQFAPVEAEEAARPSQNEKFGDYQSNAAMGLAKRVAEKTGQKANPRAVAEQIKSKLQLGEMAEEIPIAGPGFINVKLSPTWLGKRLASVADDPRIDSDAQFGVTPQQVGRYRTNVSNGRTIRFTNARVAAESVVMRSPALVE